MKEIQLIINRSELGAGTRGSSLGADALNTAALNQKNNLLQEMPAVEIPNLNTHLYDPIDTPHAIRITQIAEMYERISKTIMDHASDTTLTLILSGDHSSGGATIAGLKKKYPEKKLGVIWVDAHADMHTPYTTPSGNVHGMPLAAALGLDNIEAQRNEIQKQTKDAWDRIKNIGNLSPKILPENLIFIANRDLEIEEKELIDRLDIKSITVGELRKNGIEHVVNETLQHLHECDHVYISYDVDSLDSSISLGTGTPVPDGLYVEEVKELLFGLLQSPKVICWEITEINPTLDTTNDMAEVNLEILDHCLKGVMKK